MLIKWEGGNPQTGFPSLLTSAAILVNIFAVVVVGIPSSVPTPVTVLASSIGIPTTAASYATTVAAGRRVPKQVGLLHGPTVASPTDHQQSGTHHHHEHNNGFMDGSGGGGGFGGQGHHHHGHHGDGKYFTYAHNPGYDEYEYGYRRGNDYHFQERYEKYGPAWNFKTKVKWGDKYGGYGEHYWDYNHAGSGHDDHGHGQYSESVPSYENQPGASNYKKNVAILHKRQSDNNGGVTNKQKRSKQSKRVSPTAASSQEVDMNIAPVYLRGDNKAAESQGLPMLVLDRKTGQIIDTQTGQAYFLKPSSAQSFY